VTEIPPHLTNWCPTCVAEPGTPCKTQDGTNHPERETPSFTSQPGASVGFPRYKSRPNPYLTPGRRRRKRTGPTVTPAPLDKIEPKCPHCGGAHWGRDCSRAA